MVCVCIFKYAVNAYTYIYVEFEKGMQKNRMQLYIYSLFQLVYVCVLKYEFALDVYGREMIFIIIF